MSDEYTKEIYDYLKRVNNKEARPWEANFEIIDFDDGGAPWIDPLPMSRDQESRLCMICMSEGLTDTACYPDANSNENDPRNYYEYVTGKGNLALLKHESRNSDDEIVPLLEQALAVLTPQQQRIMKYLWQNKTASHETLRTIRSAWRDVPSDAAITKKLKEIRGRLDKNNLSVVSLTISDASHRVNLERPEDTK